MKRTFEIEWPDDPGRVTDAAQGLLDVLGRWVSMREVGQESPRKANYRATGLECCGNCEWFDIASYCEHPKRKRPVEPGASAKAVYVGPTSPPASPFCTCDLHEAEGDTP